MISCDSAVDHVIQRETVTYDSAVGSCDPEGNSLGFQQRHLVEEEAIGLGNGGALGRTGGRGGGGKMTLVLQDGLLLKSRELVQKRLNVSRHLHMHDSSLQYSVQAKLGM